MSFSYIQFLKQNKEDPFWQDILNTQYQRLGSKLEIVKSEISRNHYQMKTLMQENLDEYLASQNSVHKLKQEIQNVKVTSQSKLQELSKQFAQMQQGFAQNDLKQQSNNTFLFYKRLIGEWNHFMEMFDIEKILAQAIKLEMYDQLSQLLVWLEKLSNKQGAKGNIKDNFQKIFAKYRKIICDICFSNYKKIKKTAIKQFFVNFGSNIAPQELDQFYKDIFNAHFNKTLKIRIEKINTTISQNDYVAKLLQIYARTLHKSLIYVNNLAKQITKQESSPNIPLSHFLNKLKSSVLNLINPQKLGEKKMMEIIFLLHLYEQPLQTYIVNYSLYDPINFVNAATHKVQCYIQFIANSNQFYELKEQLDRHHDQIESQMVAKSEDQLDIIAPIIISCDLLGIVYNNFNVLTSLLGVSVNNVLKNELSINYLVTIYNSILKHYKSSQIPINETSIANVMKYIALTCYDRK